MMISTIEGNFAYGISSWFGTSRWTKDILDSLYSSGQTVDGVSVHLYPTRGYEIDSDRLLSLGASVDTDYRTWISYNYFGASNWNKGKGLIDLYRNAISTRAVKVFFTEFSDFTNINETTSTSDRRKGMHNALVYSNTFYYLNKNQVECFALHQLGRGDGPLAPGKGWNCVNSNGYLIPAALAVKLLSAVDGQLVSSNLAGSPLFDTFGAALQDNTGSLAPLNNIPYVTAVTSKNNNNTLHVALTNMSNAQVAVNLIVSGALNSNNIKFTGEYIAAPYLTDNNDNGSIQIMNYIKIINGIALLPPYSIVVLHGVK